MARTSSVVQAIQLGGNKEVGEAESAWSFRVRCRAGMSWMPTLNKGRRRSGGMLSTGKSESRELGTEERIERAYTVTGNYSSAKDKIGVV